VRPPRQSPCSRGAGDGLDQGAMQEGLREVAEVLACRGVELLGIEPRGGAIRSRRFIMSCARCASPTIASGETGQKELDDDAQSECSEPGCPLAT
jgi:hypothetical protein